MTSDLEHRAATPPTSWETTYRIRFDEAGPDGLLRTSGYMRYAQDLAWQHSTALGFGRAWYAERGLTWLVRAAELAVVGPAEMGADVAAKTEIVGIRRVFARRRGEFRIADGTLAAWVVTDWVLIDRRGALTRIPAVFPDVFGGGLLDGSIGRIALPATPSDAVRRRFAVRPHELDPMAHANNAVYLDWLEEGVLEAIAPGGATAAVAAIPRRYRMEFALAADRALALDGATWRDGTTWNYRLTGADDGVDRFRAVLLTGETATDTDMEEQR